MADANQTEALIAAFKTDHDRVKAEVQKAVVGHENIIDGVLTCLFAGGHCLLEGVPGLGKTLLIRSLSQALHLKFGRIQFTPDLMPADVTGTTIVVETPQGRDFQFRKGPLFAQIVLADEINRATPKTQSALLEAMAEQTVTIAGTRHALEEPFFVLATENPIEMEGTYPLPEAQLDRFLFKVLVPQPDEDALVGILGRTTGRERSEAPRVIDGPRLLAIRACVRDVPMAEPILRYVARLVRASDPSYAGAAPTAKALLRYGAGVRAAQSLSLAAKVAALMAGRAHVSFADVRRVALPALRHRLIPGFEAEADGISTDTIVTRLLDEVPEVPASVAAIAR
jgi:MoxR-like ATPase